MTFSDGSAGSVRSFVWPDLEHRYFQKRYVLFWTLAALLPFIFLRFFVLSEISFPFQSVSSPTMSLQPEENGQSHIVANSLAPAPGSEEVMSKTTIPESPLIRPDEDAWITHDDWINHDLNRTEDDKMIPAGFDNSTEFMKDFSPEPTNRDGFGLPEDNEKEELQFDAMEVSEKNENNPEKNTTAAEELRPEEERSGVKNMQLEESDNEKVGKEGEKQLEVTKETFQGVEQQQEHEETKFPEEEQTEEGRLQEASGKAYEETPAGECDLFEGEWVHDPEGPLYTNSTCSIPGDLNCLSNGRPDTEYMYWRWKPRGCDLPRFDAKSFLDKFRGKALAFVGDSIVGNQMRSLLCLLSQFEIPVRTNASDDYKTNYWLFREHQFTVANLWSPYLLKDSEGGDTAFEKGRIVVSLDVLDTAWTSVIQDFDVIVLSAGQWFPKIAVYMEQEEAIGCHYCPELNLTEIPYSEVYRGAIRRALEKVSDEYKGVAIMTTFPLSHFENGSWDTGGSCERKLPLQPLESTQFPGEHNEFHDIVIDEFNAVVEQNRELKKDSRVEIFDVTKVSLQRADGHPGRFRRPHPDFGWDTNEYFANDCLHWCLPGPVDTWNQLLSKIVDKHF